MSDDDVACSRCCQNYPADSPFCTTCGLAAADVPTEAAEPGEEHAEPERRSRRAVAIAATLAVVVALGVGAVVLTPFDGAAAVATNKPSKVRTAVTVESPATTSTAPATTVPPTTIPAPTTTLPTPVTTTAVAATVAAPHDIATTLVLLDPVAGVDGTWAVGKSCQGLHTAADINPTAVASVKDPKGKVLGTTALGAGTVAPSKPGSSVMACVFHFTFPAVPTTTSYVFTVANRGRITVSAAGMQAAGWTLALRLS